MKFSSYLHHGQTHLGVVDGPHLIDLQLQIQQPSLRQALAAGIDLPAAARTALASDGPRLPLAGLQLAPPVPDPGKTICLGLNYFDHAKEGGRDKPDYPWFFFRGATSFIAHGQAGQVPRVSAMFDYEAELAVVIGSRVPRHCSADAALHHVFGYSCFNDMSVRDFQKRTPQWTIGKNFDATGGFGPCVVTADELPRGASGLHIEGRLNGQVMQSASTADMIFSVAETLALLAQVLTLEPGDVIAMGTPAGVGQARKPPVWMRAGDVFEVEIEGIGLLRNPIVAEPQ